MIYFSNCNEWLMGDYEYHCWQWILRWTARKRISRFITTIKKNWLPPVQRREPWDQGPAAGPQGWQYLAGRHRAAPALEAPLFGGAMRHELRFIKNHQRNAKAQGSLAGTLARPYS